jgi:hypothetical protein
MMTGQVSEIESCVLFAYGCRCHALANLAKDWCAAPDVKDTVSKSMQAAALFRNTAIARHMLEEWQRGSNREPRPRSIKSFSPTRWKSISELLSSLACDQDGIVTILTNQKMAVGNDRRLDFEKSSSKASVVAAFALEGTFWARLKAIAPVFSLITSVITFLESDGASLSTVPLGFSFLYNAVENMGLPSAIIRAIQTGLVKRFYTIACDAHALAVLLDPGVTSQAVDGLKTLYQTRNVVETSRAALKRVCSWLDLSAIEEEKLRSEFNMHLSGLDGNQNLRSREYHPLLWWNIEGRDKTRRRSKAASLVFSLFPSAAGNERSFKVRSRVHSKTRNRLSDENADKQSYIVYNSAQIRRIDDGEILNSKRDSAVEVALLNGCSEVELENLRALQPSARQSLVLSSQGLSQGNPQSREAAGGELADGLEGSDIDLESVDGLLNSARHSGENDIDVLFADGFEVLE